MTIGKKIGNLMIINLNTIMESNKMSKDTKDKQQPVVNIHNQQALAVVLAEGLVGHMTNPTVSLPDTVGERNPRSTFSVFTATGALFKVEVRVIAQGTDYISPVVTTKKG